MGQWHPYECKVCGARRPHVHISGTGLCPDHAIQRVERNITSLRRREGEYFDAWLRGIAKGVTRTARARA